VIKKKSLEKKANSSVSAYFVEKACRKYFREEEVKRQLYEEAAALMLGDEIKKLDFVRQEIKVKKLADELETELTEKELKSLQETNDLVYTPEITSVLLLGISAVFMIVGESMHSLVMLGLGAFEGGVFLYLKNKLEKQKKQIIDAIKSIEFK